MKAKLSMFRLSRRFILILAGVVVLSGASAAFAVYVGTEAILGPPQSKVSGLECTNVAVVKLRINGQRWVRKFVKTESTDGLVRVKTALRVASAFSKAEKADLYQVVVIDQNGPDKRGAMRGRAIGADVLFTPRPGDVTGMEVAFKARYTDGKANAVGLFSGDRIDMPLDDVKSTIRAMEDKSDCTDPPLAEGETAKVSEHGEAKEAGHEKPAEKSEGHGEAAPAAHGEEAETSGHDAAPAESGDQEMASHEKKPHLPTFEDFAALDDSDAGHERPEHTVPADETPAQETGHEASGQQAAGHEQVEQAAGGHEPPGEAVPVEIEAEGHATAHD